MRVRTCVRVYVLACVLVSVCVFVKEVWKQLFIGVYSKSNMKYEAYNQVCVTKQFVAISCWG